MFVAIVGIAVLFNLALFLAIAIGEAINGHWAPLITLGQGFGFMAGFVLLLCVPSLIMDAARWMRRKRRGDVSPIIED